MLSDRFVAPAFVVLMIAVARRGHRLTPAVTVAIPLATLAVTWPQFADAADSARQFEEIVPLIEPGSATALMELDRSARPGRAFSTSATGGRVLALRGGRVQYAFVQSPIAPVRLEPRSIWYESEARALRQPVHLVPEHDLKRYRYVIVHCRLPPVQDAAIRALSPEAALKSRSGEWLLFESTLARVPITAGDAALPDPLPATFGMRLRDALAERPH